MLLEKAKEYAQLTRRWIILPLHSALSIEEQDRVISVVTTHPFSSNHGHHSTGV